MDALSFTAVPLFLMGMLLTAIVVIYIKTDRPPDHRTPLTRKQLRKLTHKEIDRYVEKHYRSAERQS